jgi:hypothetical protein
MPEWDHEHEHTMECTPANCDISPIAYTAMRQVGPFLTTVSGRRMYFTNPSWEMVDLEDIAHHLSNICHWNGACRSFFSVAQHSILVSRIVPFDLRPWGLLHDAAEAYVGDMTRSLKWMLPEFKAIEERVLHAIADKFNLPWPVPPELKHYDDQIIKLEAQLLMPATIQLRSRQQDDTPLPDLGVAQQLLISNGHWTHPMPPDLAKLAFMTRYRKIFLDDDGL